MPESTHSGAETVHQASASAAPTLGNWTIVELLGEGSWSQVYRARPRDSADFATSDYALKVARTTAGEGEVARWLLHREACVAEAVAHQHLTCVLSAHLRRPPYYLVMPFQRGVNLQVTLNSAGHLPLPHALWLARQLAEALQALHAQGWLHCDIKPSNILVSPTGHVTLLDLGLAQRIDESLRGDDMLLAGTLAYTPPELFGAVLPRGTAADVYSLGVTLYEMVTGELPFPETSAAALAEAHLAAPIPDPRRRNPRISARLARLLRKMLAKQPDQRPATTDLIAWLADLEIDLFDERFAA